MAQPDPIGTALVLGKRLLKAFVYRLDLLELELREEQFRFLLYLTATVIGLFLLFLGILLANIALVLSLWDSYGSTLLWLMALFYVLLGIAFSSYVWYKLASSDGPFSASLRELRRDLGAIRRKSDESA